MDASAASGFCIGGCEEEAGGDVGHCDLSRNEQTSPFTREPAAMRPRFFLYRQCGSLNSQQSLHTQSRTTALQDVAALFQTALHPKFPNVPRCFKRSNDRSIWAGQKDEDKPVDYGENAGILTGGRFVDAGFQSETGMMNRPAPLRHFPLSSMNFISTER